jgi:hypothetical protein
MLLALLMASEVQAQDFSYTNTNGTITITGYTGSGGAVTIPSTIAGLPVTSLGDSVFAGSSTLTRVLIPDSVTNIGQSTFGSCAVLTNVSIGNGVRSIGYAAFMEPSGADHGFELWGAPEPVWVQYCRDGRHSVGD